MIDIPQKQCSRSDCKQWYPATTEFFHRHKSMKDGLHEYCKVCRRKLALERYYQHPEFRQERRIWLRAYKKTPRGREQKRTYKRTRRARKRDASGTHTLAQILDLLRRQHCRCYYC